MSESVGKMDVMAQGACCVNLVKSVISLSKTLGNFSEPQIFSSVKRD